MNHMAVSRRTFLKGSGAVVVSGLIIGFVTGPAAARTGAGKLNTWVVIAPDDEVRILIGYSEMGQGITTSLPQVIADELDADWSTIRMEFAPADAAFANPVFGIQGTGGSTTTYGSWETMRAAGATARAMLEQAAAKRWNVNASAVRSENGAVVNASTGESLRFGALALAAAEETPPKVPPLKDPSAWRFIGKPVDRLDIPAKVDGTAGFGIDVQIPGMLVATISQCPVFGGSLKSVDDAPAMAVRGVKAVVPLKNAVAVAADGYWPAKKGLDALMPVWDEGTFAGGGSDTTLKEFHATLDDAGAVADAHGDLAAGFAATTKTIEADYTAPYLAHATMEPMNATAHVTEDGVTFWAPTQWPGLLTIIGAKVLGVDASKITVHSTYLGGGYGRRFEPDFCLQAALISKAVGAPVKLMWSREEDMRHDFYRPGSVCRMRVGLGEDGLPSAWETRIACSSIFSRTVPQRVKDGLDHTSVEGAVHLPYALPNRRIDYRLMPSPIPVGFWRSVGNSQNGWFTESMIDEAAHAAGDDPLAYRLKLLADSPEHAAVLKAAADAAGWGKAPAGRFQGIALVESFKTIAAEVVELSVSADKEITLHRLTVAADPGSVVNPRNFEGQLQGALVYGLTAALYGRIDVVNGRVEQGNFDTYAMVRLSQLPPITVTLVPSGRPMGGAGEPGTPPIAPALCNALFAATGERIRSLPLMDHGYTLEPVWG
ncbi:MAG: xanthine dehydrogenase family protein molybdopterin-binding subunit [Rhodospirillales bacterium]|nr:xanthine dehydrogenase family protein molybdopterin-binding subunit [Rhodospirillales bacterium]